MTQLILFFLQKLAYNQTFLNVETTLKHSNQSENQMSN